MLFIKFFMINLETNIVLITGWNEFPLKITRSEMWSYRWDDDFSSVETHRTI